MGFVKFLKSIHLTLTVLLILWISNESYAAPSTQSSPGKTTGKVAFGNSVKSLPGKDSGATVTRGFHASEVAPVQPNSVYPKKSNDITGVNPQTLRMKRDISNYKPPSTGQVFGTNNFQHLFPNANGNGGGIGGMQKWLSMLMSKPRSTWVDDYDEEEEDSDDIPAIELVHGRNPAPTESLRCVANAAYRGATKCQ